MKALVSSAFALALMALPALAHHDGEIVEKNGITASHAHIEEPVAATAHGAHVYLTIENAGDAPDRLIAASVPFAAPGRFEANVLGADGTLEIRTVSAVSVKPGQTVQFAPGALRIAFDDIKKALGAGSHFALTLTFENAGTLTLVGEVEDGHGGDHHGDEHTHDEDEPAS